MRKTPKIGRPLLPKGDARESRLFCRLLESEVAEIEAAVKRSKKNKSEWIREVLLRAAKIGERQ